MSLPHSLLHFILQPFHSLAKVRQHFREMTPPSPYFKVFGTEDGHIGLHDGTSQKSVLFIVTAVRTLNYNKIFHVCFL
jgi:deoxyxylulose-5-phosphate synthase